MHKLKWGKKIEVTYHKFKSRKSCEQKKIGVVEIQTRYSCGNPKVVSASSESLGLIDSLKWLTLSSHSVSAPKMTHYWVVMLWLVIEGTWFWGRVLIGWLGNMLISTDVFNQSECSIQNQVFHDMSSSHVWRQFPLIAIEESQPPIVRSLNKLILTHILELIAIKEARISYPEFCEVFKYFKYTIKYSIE